MAYSAKEDIYIYIMNMLSELGFENEFNCVPLLRDNAGALHIAGNSICSARTKYTALRLLILKVLVRDGK